MDKNYIRIPWRMERLPANSYTRLIAGILGLCFFFEWVDNGSISYFLPVFAEEFKLNEDVLGVIASVSNIGVMCGCLISGLVSDKIGRKKVICMAMVLWGIAGVAQAVVPSLTYLVIVRIILGLGLGIQLPATITLVSESVPSKMRAKYTVILLALAPLGSTFAGILCYFALPSSIGWRGVSIIEAVPALTALVIWKVIPESALWLEAKGRIQEADEIMSRVEKKVEAALGSSLPPVVIPDSAPAAAPKKQGKQFAQLFSKKFLRTNIMTSIWWPCTMMASYGLTAWFSMIFVQKGIDLSSSIGYTSIMTLGGCLGVLFLPKVLDRFGRKVACCVIAAIAALGAYCYGSVEAIPLLILFGMIFNAGSQGVAQVSVTYASESYPTSVRNTGVGYAQFIGRLGSVLGPMCLGLVMNHWGIQSSVFFAAALYVVGALAVIFLGAETKGKVFTEE